MNKLTNIRTFVQFTQYGEVKKVTFNGNKLMALHSIKSQYGIKSVSVLHEYKAEGYGIEGYHTMEN